MIRFLAFLRDRAALLALLFACLVLGSCTKPPPPEPTQTKEERREKEKEMMHREMMNK